MQWQNSKYGWLLGHVVCRLEPGKAFRAQYGSEFRCQATSFRNYVYAAASAQGYRASAMVFEHIDHPVVVYVFYHPNDLMRPNLAAYPIVKRLRRE